MGFKEPKHVADNYLKLVINWSCV